MKKLGIFLMMALICMMVFSPTLALSHHADGCHPDDHYLAAQYVGATTTGKFHYTSCRWANKIRSDHRVYFETRDEAIAAGYVPCKVCAP